MLQKEKKLLLVWALVLVIEAICYTEKPTQITQLALSLSVVFFLAVLLDIVVKLIRNSK
ncbi:hypothetical protein JDS99_05410 [Bacillus cereus group sp. N6]|uniref:hypothetical protein n=1 Tax=Bacillus cereus group sp. N6 TaxID=2794583 RepID=UPI0018F3D696|nr:hypothetical protein [Bacillus cereus group sp. N6]MBJ8109089.1 hypothetical protein [Bacillus cereus group sp. N6]